jgi:hypothetical protein
VARQQRAGEVQGGPSAGGDLLRVRERGGEGAGGAEGGLDIGDVGTRNAAALHNDGVRENSGPASSGPSPAPALGLTCTPQVNSDSYGVLVEESRDGSQQAQGDERPSVSLSTITVTVTRSTARSFDQAALAWANSAVSASDIGWTTGPGMRMRHHRL